MTVTSYPITANQAFPALPTATTNTPATLSPVDLTSVYCVSRSLCFAAGGFMPPSTFAVTFAAQTASSFGITGAAVSKVFPQFGQILRSTNGGSFLSVSVSHPTLPQCLGFPFLRSSLVAVAYQLN